MKRRIILLLSLISVFIISCKDDCDPGLPPVSDRLYLNILNANGSSFSKFVGGAIPDSFKVINLSNNAVVPRTIIYDSVIIIENFTAINTGGVNTFKIMKGNLKPDTVTVTVNNKTMEDLCGNPYNVMRWSQIKVNNAVKCSDCAFNTAVTYIR
jgi:hypothetical protein